MDTAEIANLLDDDGRVRRWPKKQDQKRLVLEYLSGKFTVGVEYSEGEANKPVYEKDLWDDRGSWFQAPSIRGVADIGVSVAAVALSGGAALPALLGSAAINLADDAVFGALDLAGGYKSWEEAGLDFGKKALVSAVNVATAGVFNGYSDVSSGFFSQGLSAGLSGTSGIGNVIGKSMLSGMQTLTTSTLSSGINAVYWGENGLGFSDDAFASGIKGGFVSAATGITSGVVSGGLNLGLEGFTGNVYANGNALSNFVGGLAGQGLNYALTGETTFNLANFDMFGMTGVNGNPVSMGLLELHLGKNGASMNLGSGGMDASLGTIAKAAAGFEAWGVNAKMLLSGQDEAKKYASALRTLYSSGGAASDERNLFERILAGQTDVVEQADGDYKARTTYDAGSGTHTISLGADALSDGSRFGMNILLAHEAYRNGIDDGAEGQAYETRSAVLGHIQAAGALGTTYGMGALGSDQLAEVRALQMAYRGDSSSLAGIVGGYDSSKDFWRLLQDASGNHFEWDGQLDFDLSVMGIQERQASLSDEHVAAMWGYQQGIVGNAFQTQDAFSSVVMSFNTVGVSATNFEALFTDGANPTDTAFNNARGVFLNSLRGIGKSGLLSRIPRILADPGEGPHIFANGRARMTSDYGWRVRTWPHGPDSSIDDDLTQWHNGWDAVAVGNTSYVAPFAGSLDLGFTEDGGLSLVSRDSDVDASRRVDYKHAAASSITSFVGLFAMEGTTLHASGRLGGIAQNMIIGAMGNTGSATTGAHGHIVYSQWDNEYNRWEVENPANLFGAGYFNGRIETWAAALSGWDQNPNEESFRISQANIRSAFEWSRSHQDLDFGLFISSNRARFSSDINWYSVYSMVRSAE